ncbi:hypothetical protein [Vibrio mangrovi]|uniref:Uncharacterized protein n=1 Tax=Vibrio mangrovi TaxID=474394 RepID=A0A1Y6IW85_9VIBR|nr:hypothetical protein [Vibrio mangrovi]MDW6002543.1 hypothetical protein [Vibrio mangrovi]SMS01924.1 hypothetical protein VIM7927_03235 [Vibrio mangrovi]
MKYRTLLTTALFLSTNAFAQSIYVDAIGNNVGPNGGEYYEVKVERDVTYELEITDNDAIFNTNDGARMTNLGVMYVQPPRKMRIETVEAGKKTYIETEGRMYFFFVDDGLLNSGGAHVSIEKVNAQ